MTHDQSAPADLMNTVLGIGAVIGGDGVAMTTVCTAAGVPTVAKVFVLMNSAVKINFFIFNLQSE